MIEPDTRARDVAVLESMPTNESELALIEWACSDDDDAPDGPPNAMVLKLLAAYRDLQKVVRQARAEGFGVIRINGPVPEQPADMIKDFPGKALEGFRVIGPAEAAVLEAVKECERIYSLHVPWPVAEELRIALIKDCPHTQRFEFQGGEWQCERCGKQGDDRG